MSPATIDTSTQRSAVQYGWQRKAFHAAGLFWAFYTNGTNAGWEFTANPNVWTGAFTSIGACPQGHDFAIWFDGTYIHYVRSDAVTYDLFYRRGVPENDGSITWSAVEQTVYDGASGDEYDSPSISVDTNGYAWIGVLKTDPAPWERPYVLKNANNDGTWAQDFAYELNATDNYSWRVSPIPLTDGKVYVVYCRSAYSPLGKLYDAGWGAEENDLADYPIEWGNMFSAVALGNNVHFVYNRDMTNQIRHNERVWGVGWDAADVLVQDNMPTYCGPALSCDPSEGTLYCFWTNIDTYHVYYKEYDAGWDADPTDWIDESTDGWWRDYLISSYYQDYGGYIGLLYITKTASPFNVRFAYPGMPPPPPEKSWMIDTLFKALGIEETHDIDAAFQLRGIERKPDIDALFVLYLELQRQFDVFFRRFGVLRPVDFDTVFQKLFEITTDLDTAFQLRDIQKSADIDALFVPRIALQRQFDTLFKRFDVEKLADFDTAFQRRGIERKPDIDALFVLYLELQRTVDAAFQLQDIEKTPDIDVLFSIIIQKSLALDAKFKGAIIEIFGLGAGFGDPFYVTMNGTIVSSLFNCLERGFEWGFETGVYTRSWTETGSFPTGAYSHQIQGLVIGQHYFYRAKARNSLAGPWGYGEEKIFRFPPTFEIDAFFKALSVEMTAAFDAAFKKYDVPNSFGLDVYFFVYPPPIIVYVTSDEVEAELTSDEVMVRVVV